MADVFSKKKRGEIMSRIRSKDTGIEKAVFSYLRKQKIYFQKHYRKAPGNPDVSLPSKKKAIFINGDFWHGYKFPIWKNRIPKKYWREKIAYNIFRDKKNCRILKKAGWKVMKIWGHDIAKRPEKTLQKIKVFLET